MVVISLKIRLADLGIVKTIQFNNAIQVYDACKVVREKLPEAAEQLGGGVRDYGLFMPADDPRQGCWLDSSKNLDYYLLRNGDTLEYRKKIRPLRIRMLDGSVKTVMVDESQILKHLLPFICTKIGIANYDEYDLVRERPAGQDPSAGSTIVYGGTLHRQDQTLRRAYDQQASSMTAASDTGGTLKSSRSNAPSGTLGREQRKMEKLRAKLATDDDVAWTDQSRTLLQQGIDESETLLLKRRYFYSDQNVDAQDPLQLNLLYVQCRDQVLHAQHPVTQEQAVRLGGLQAHIQFGGASSGGQAPPPLDPRDFLPPAYARQKAIDRKLYDEFMRHRGALAESDAKVQYVRECRSLKTYGVTFFLVKEKMKGRNKLVPRLLGVQRDSVLRLDEKTKEVLTLWPLTQVKRWAASPNTFTLDFGDYSDEFCRWLQMNK